MDPTLLAVLAHRFEAIVREMTNTLFRTGRSSILNMARDFSCSIITADDELFAAAEGLQVHVLGAGLQTSSMRELHPDLREGDAFLHNDPLLGNTHTADHTILVPVFVDGEHIFTASAKAHQADCGNAEPSTYVAYAEDVYARGRARLPLRQGPGGLHATSRTSSACAGAGSACPTSGTATTWRRSAPPGSASAGSRRRSSATAWRRSRPSSASGSTTPSGSMEQAIRKLPATAPGGPLPARPDPRPARGRRGQRHAPRSTPSAGKVTFDLRDNPDCIPFGINVSEACARGGCTIALLNCLRGGRPAQRRRLPPHRGADPRGLDRRRPGRALLGLGLDHQRPQPDHQRRPERLLRHGRRPGPGRGRRRARGRLRRLLRQPTRTASPTSARW